MKKANNNIIPFNYQPEEIPQGNTKNDIKLREKIIVNFYAHWKSINTQHKIYNNSLNAFIEVKFTSLNETKQHAAKQYLSTLSILQLSAILKESKKDPKPIPIKKGVKNQVGFKQMHILRTTLLGIGDIKLTVGEKHNGRYIQYCITSVEYKKSTKE